MTLADTLLRTFSFVDPRPKIRPQNGGDIGGNEGEEEFRW